MPRGVRGRGTCSIEGCRELVVGRGWCNRHYLRWKRSGDPLVVAFTKYCGSMPERLWPRVNKTETCWLWTGRTDRNGYGMFSLAGRNHLAHRLVYEFMVEPIPTGLTLDHLCGIKVCVRPNHLEPVTTQENTRRYWAKVAAAS